MERQSRRGCAERGSSSAPASGDEPGRSGVCSAPVGGALLLGARGSPFPHPGRRSDPTALRHSGRRPTGRCAVCVCATGSEGALPRQGDAADPACLLSIGRLLVQGRSQEPPGVAPPTVRGARPTYVPLPTIPPCRWLCQEPFDGRSQPLVAGDRPVSRRERQRRGVLHPARDGLLQAQLLEPPSRAPPVGRYPAASRSVSSPRVSPASAGARRTAISVPAT
jgi:hypothetical protein